MRAWLLRFRFPLCLHTCFEPRPVDGLAPKRVLQRGAHVVAAARWEKVGTVEADRGRVRDLRRLALGEIVRIRGGGYGLDRRDDRARSSPNRAGFLRGHVVQEFLDPGLRREGRDDVPADGDAFVAVDGWGVKP